ncbi:MAG TPA: ABC transporter permease [Thermomicrobiales bacterium]|nr:ABC transporter permease [Thermomicrobiales bacterium]
MTIYIARRLLLMIPLLFGISVVSYAVIRFAPGDPARLLADPERVSAAQLAAAREQMGLNDPLPIQYLKTMRSLATGDLRSFKTHRPVLAMIGERLPTTLTLTALALVCSVVFGLTIGIVQSLRPYSRVDDAGTLVSLFGFSVPDFWLALTLIGIFAVRLGWLPASGIRPPQTDGWNPRDVAPHLVLPTFVLSASTMAGIARYTRSAMLEALGQDFVRLARAKGLRERQVVVRHALRNSLLPVITLLGFYVPFLLGGAVVVETIFALPGIGRLALDSVASRDYPVLLTINVLGALTVLVGNLLADVGYALADPRIRYG